MNNPTDTGATPESSQRKRRPRLLQALAVAAVFATGGFAMHIAQAATDDNGDAPSMFHHHHCDGSPEKMKAHLDKVLTDVGTTDTQKQQIETLVSNAITATHADMKQYHTNLQQLRTLLTADPIDDNAVAALRAQQEQLAQTMSDRATDTAVSVSKSLTPDQRAKLGAQIEQMMSAAHGPHHSM
jgi:Spy/CpxP family protein refolding chaperone